jgi:N-acetylmuramoyl-L-alanine amidase
MQSPNGLQDGLVVHLGEADFSLLLENGIAPCSMHKWTDLSCAAHFPCKSVMKHSEWYRVMSPWKSSAIASAVGLSLTALAGPVGAVAFDSREVDPSRFIAIAAPAGRSLHQLLILEQVNDSRACWQESGAAPAVVEPLLLEFDFTDICNRSTDSNGYSVRVGGDDLGWRYSLRVVKSDNDMVLVAVSNRDPSVPPIEIGRTNGLTDGFARITLTPGWRMTQRVYEGEAVGHIYLTNDQDIETLIATASESPIRAARPIAQTRPATAPLPESPRPTTLTPAASPSSPSVPVMAAPSVTAPEFSLAGINAPPGLQPLSTRPPVVAGTPTSSAAPASPTSQMAAAPTGGMTSTSSGTTYRVIARANTSTEQEQVKAVVPDAFQTTYNGQSVMQAGLFRDRSAAGDLQRRLQQQNLNVSIIPVQSNQLSQSRPASSGTPMATVPRGQRIVAIDPGHGGRDPGAVGVGGLEEAEVVLSISERVSALLQQQGVQTVLTRRDDREIDLAPRVSTAENARADLLVSIHANSVSAERSEVNGVETYFHASSTSQQLAQTIQSNLVAATGMVNRGVKEARLYMLTQTSMPAALVEVGFVTGRDDSQRLRNPSSQAQIAEGIARGILQFIQRGF